MAEGIRLPKKGRARPRPSNPGSLGKVEGARTNRSAILMGGSAPKRPKSLLADDAEAEVIDDLGVFDDEAVDIDDMGDVDTVEEPSRLGVAPTRSQQGERVPRSPQNIAGPDDIDESKYKYTAGRTTPARKAEVARQKAAGVLASSEDWDDDRSNDPHTGPAAEGRRPEEAGVNTRTGTTKKKRRLQITDRDVQMIKLLGRYKFGYRSQVEAYCERRDLSRRLTQLKNHGLLRDERLTQNHAVWTPTQAGIEMVGLDVPNLAHGKVSPATIGHTVGLLNLGIGFEKGDEANNLLGEAEYPHEWRREQNRDLTYRLEQGETVITERMIAQSWRRVTSLYDDHEVAAMYRKAVEWKPSRPGELNAFGPEAEEGNEWMFVGQKPFKAHVPDMVLVRPRNPDGSARHIAIELELNTKPLGEWRRILSGFKGSPMFSTVAYFTHKRSVREGVRGVNAKDVGMVEGSELIIKKYVPRLDNPFWG